MFKRRFGLIKDFSIPARLRTAGALALFGLIVTSAAGYIGLMQSNEGLATSIASTSAVLYQKDADMLHDALRSDVLRAMMAAPWASDKERQALHSDLNQHIASFKLDMNNLEQLDLSADMKARIAAVRPTMDAYIAAAIDMTETALGDAAAAQTKLPAFNGKFTALEMQMGALGKEIQRIGNATGKAALERNLRLVNILIGAAVAGALVLIVSNLVIARSITRPLTRVRDAIREVAVGNMGGRRSAFDRVSDLRDEVTEIAAYLDRLRERLHEAIAMEEAIQRRQADQQAVVSALTVGLGNLSSGDLSQPITETFPPDYETLRENFNATVDRLNHTITQVVQASRSIRGQSDQISHASEDLARRTENQAATLEETAAALDELTTSVRSAANSAREVEAIVQSARREAEDSGKVVLGAVDAMNGIERSSEQISQIIGVIDDIAFQTNLLALNAGVEAARAGEAGRGFAVVASEVRALAQRSSEASKEIKALISSSSHFVGRGVEAVGSAGRALTTMVERVTHISTLVSEITAGAQEQSIGLGEVNVGVTQLDQVAQKNAAMVEQSMLATQSLRNEAIGLDSLVSQFATRHAGAAEKPRLRAAG